MEYLHGEEKKKMKVRNSKEQNRKKQTNKVKAQMNCRLYNHPKIAQSASYCQVLNLLFFCVQCSILVGRECR
jgi:hypothetical protein